MSNQNQYPDTLRPRLSDYYLSLWPEGTDNYLTAHGWIGSLRRDDVQGGYSVTFNGREYNIRSWQGFGTLRIDGEPFSLYPTSKKRNPSIGECVCAAVQQHLLTQPTPPTAHRNKRSEGQQQQQQHSGQQQQQQNTHTLSEYLIKRWLEIAAYLDGSDRQTRQVGLRMAQQHGRMVSVGLPIEAGFHAFALDWSDETREAARIPEFDPMTYGEPIDNAHRAVPYILKLIEARINVALIGPAGTGKTHITSQVAELLNLKHGDISFSEDASVAWLFGRQTLNGYVSAEFVERYVDGGVMCLDELDAADANTTLALNKALANDSFTNPITGDVCNRHRDFIAAGCMNTMGNGADSEFAGRNKLDGALLDRFSLGRVFIGHDRHLFAELLRSELGEYANRPASDFNV